jgi:hypothetical protein
MLTVSARARLLVVVGVVVLLGVVSVFVFNAILATGKDRDPEDVGRPTR